MKAWSRWQDWVGVVVGVWLFISPWILGFSAVGSAAWSGWILGALVFVAALWALGSPNSRTPEWCNVVLGAAAILAPWVLGFSNLGGPVWGFVVSGLIVLVGSVWAMNDAGKSPYARST